MPLLGRRRSRTSLRGRLIKGVSAYEPHASGAADGEFAMNNRLTLRWAFLRGIPVLAAGLLAQTLLPSSNAMASAPIVIDEYRELMIVHPSVVDPFLNGGRSHNGSPNDA